MSLAALAANDPAAIPISLGPPNTEFCPVGCVETKRTDAILAEKSDGTGPEHLLPNTRGGKPNKSQVRMREVHVVVDPGMNYSSWPVIAQIA